MQGGAAHVGFGAGAVKEQKLSGKNAVKKIG
jgi:hypothetical protein